ncbi:MAG TPA: hypothetical protein VET45_18350 [Candidatus Binatia bacterium]|nr:hypothetical protein [Candidatus Binatia bacterium]
MMRPTFRKLEVKDIGTLERLVAENVEGIEPGLKIVDSRLLLGQAAIDLVGLDARGSLVLIALDFSAHEGLLLRVMDAYSWCLEYPDTLRRLYPMAQASTSRPPRILFIVERLTDPFLRRIKQLSFLAIDCLEFRHLEVNGASVVYFDLVERLRKSVVESTVDPGAQAPVSVAPPVVPAIERHVEPAKIAMEQPAPVEPPRAVVIEPRRVDPPKAVMPEPVRVAPEKLAVVEPEPVAEPIVAIPSAPVPVAQPAAVVAVAPPPAFEYQSVKLVAEPAAAVPRALEPDVAEPGPTQPALALQGIEATASLAAHDAGTNGSGIERRSTFERPVIETPVREPVVGTTSATTAPISAPVAEAVPVESPAVVIEPEPPAPMMPAEPVPTSVQPPPVWAKPGAQPNGTRPHFFAQASKGTSPVEAPALVAAVAAPAEQPTQPAASKVGLEVDDRPELESLSFPKDGLSRQWLEFLSQLGATK